MSLKRVHSFPAVVSPAIRVLILGSMPGQHSLQAQQYYAHPRNAFWSVIAHLTGVSFDVPYPVRCEQLLQQGIGLWDVLHSCRRRGSLDADIDEQSIQVNAIGALLLQCPQIQAIGFNGRKAEAAFRRYLWDDLQACLQGIDCLLLPSTSPAHARLSLQHKQASWRRLQPYLRPA